MSCYGYVLIEFDELNTVIMVIPLREYWIFELRALEVVNLNPKLPDFSDIISIFTPLIGIGEPSWA